MRREIREQIESSRLDVGLNTRDRERIRCALASTKPHAISRRRFILKRLCQEATR
jgi:hypothetical protein